jgi:hypothetical protein
LKKVLAGSLFAMLAFAGIQKAQAQGDDAQIHGNIQIDAQYYNDDPEIDAAQPPADMGFNGFGNIIFSKGNFTSGIRFESYLPALQGFDSRYDGSGIAYRYATYTTDDLEVTLGNFYEQFGSGLIFRSYEARLLGYDNAMDGFRVKYTPFPGLYLKGVYGKQRLYFEKGPALVRGFDGELSLREVNENWAEWKTNVVIGGSFVSKFQADEDPFYILPENVGSYAGRLNLIRSIDRGEKAPGTLNFGSEMVYKINDPTDDNGFIYKNGLAVFSTLAYSHRGFGLTLSGKIVDQMSYRSARSVTGVNDLFINFNPALTRQHTYNLLATLYPYASQPLGEAAFQGEITYKFKKKSVLGGKYGTTVAFNYSAANNIDTTGLNDLASDTMNGRLGYETNYFGVGKQKYWQEYNLEITKKFSKKVKGIFDYSYVLNNVDVSQGLQGHGTVKAHVVVADVQIKLKPKHAIRIEAQYLYKAADETLDALKLAENNNTGDWAFGLVEYTISPHWSFSVLDQYNLGNLNDEFKLHYLTGAVVYSRDNNRFQVQYGRQRAGIFCIGGVCRPVPAANGLLVTITSSF